MEEKNQMETCFVEGIQQDIIYSVKQRMPDVSDLSRLSEMFKLLGETTRIRLLWALSESEMCVCDLCVLLQMKQPAVSHQLKNLKQSRIVRSRREGKVVFYSLDDEHIRKLLGVGMEHVAESR